MTDLTGKTALVTGGSRGLGAAIAKRLAMAGAAVALTYVQAADQAREVAKQIDYLGADPTVKGKEAEYSQDSKTMLEIDLRAEQETIKSYRERIRQAERAGEYALSETLRDIIAEEQDHEIDLKDALGLR